MPNLLVSGSVELERNLKEKLLLRKKAEVTPSISLREHGLHREEEQEERKGNKIMLE